ncbi:MAG: hypothetical protein EZS28_037998 [Streblomastix strix]|uniref:Uncharacterized protein n=1 Tax=Streblomastix strix TaxID=222440 RepID=A0A5J4U9X2_9EUKA|nr:MAG: hypothetical protein EZS28_037998 [Streblomastix strix]
MPRYTTSKKQGEYNEEFMDILLHYFRTLDIQGFDAEDFIVQASRKTVVEYNEQLERQYAGLNQVDRYIVDIFPIFEIGVPIEAIKIEKYQIRGLAIKLKSSLNIIKHKQFNIPANEGDEAETNPNQDDGSEYI